MSMDQTVVDIHMLYPTLFKYYPNAIATMLPYEEYETYKKHVNFIQICFESYQIHTKSIMSQNPVPENLMKCRQVMKTNLLEMCKIYESVLIQYMKHNLHRLQCKLPASYQITISKESQPDILTISPKMKPDELHNFIQAVGKDLYFQLAEIPLPNIN